MSDGFTTTRLWGLFVKTSNNRQNYGNVRLFSNKGPVVFTYAQDNPDFALVRTWRFKILTIFHIGPGEESYPEGWSFEFAKISFVKIYNGVSLQFQWAHQFHSTRDRYIDSKTQRWIKRSSFRHMLRKVRG